MKFITHDVDSPDPDFRERFKRECRYTAVLYMTNSHLSDSQRYRVVYALKEDMTGILLIDTDSANWTNKRLSDGIEGES